MTSMSEYSRGERKKTYVIQVLLPFVVSCLLSLGARQVGAVELGKSLELVLTTDRSQYHLDDQMRIEARLVNNGDNAVYLLGILSWGFRGNLRLSVFDDEGNEVPREFPEHGGIIPSMAGDRSLALRLEVDHFFGTWRVNDVSYFVQHPGRYKFVVQYIPTFSAEDFNVEPFWGEGDGVVESSTFIEVVNP